MKRTETERAWGCGMHAAALAALLAALALVAIGAPAWASAPALAAMAALFGLAVVTVRLADRVDRLAESAADAEGLARRCAELAEEAEDLRDRARAVESLLEEATKALTSAELRRCAAERKLADARKALEPSGEADRCAP